jgi:1,4-alpha-glucan branching enzyme
MKTNVKKEKSKKVNFSLHAPQAESVSIAGDFNHWDVMSHSMKKDKKGVWKVSLNLSPGIYQYNFYVDGEWQNDPHCTEYVENPFGTLNSVKRME